MISRVTRIATIRNCILSLLINKRLNYIKMPNQMSPLKVSTNKIYVLFANNCYIILLFALNVKPLSSAHIVRNNGKDKKMDSNALAVNH